MKQRAYLVIGLSYGDESKGSIVDFLCREHGANLVVRHSGGCQCSHTVCLEDGTSHCFAQFGSGAFTGARTYYSRFALFEPYALFNEAEVLGPKLGRDPLKDFYLEEGALVITPFHWIAGRLREQARGAGAHGSCGMGVGEARMDQLDNQPCLTAGDLAGEKSVSKSQAIYEKLLAIKALKEAQIAALGMDCALLENESLFSVCYFYERLAKKIHIVPNGSLAEMIDGPVVCEGSQGVLLDERFGSYPHCTWTDCTFAKAERLLEGIPIEKERIGVVRTYATRHGPGPFVTESAEVNYPEPHNSSDGRQGKFRQGYFDMAATRYAIECCGGVDTIALTHLDRAQFYGRTEWVYADRDDLLSDVAALSRSVFHYAPRYRTATDPVAAIERALGVPVGYTSHGPTAAQKKRLVAA